MQTVLRTLVVIGVGMVLGDGVLTPSVSVLSSMEGLAVADPSNPLIQKGERAPPLSSVVIVVMDRVRAWCIGACALAGCR